MHNHMVFGCHSVTARIRATCTNVNEKGRERERESEIKLAFIKVRGCPFLLQWIVCALLKSVDSACGIQDVFGLWRVIGLSRTSNTHTHTCFH